MASRLVDDLVALLEGSQLLTNQQCEELRSGSQGHFERPSDLAAALVSRGWLTKLQAGQALVGKAEQLTLGPYVLLELLGEGGMGQVFKAEHRLMHRLVAIKVIRPEYVARREIIQRFQREIRAAAQLSHPNIVMAYDAAELGGSFVLVMELVDGIDLGRLVRERGPLPVVQACHTMCQAAMGLQHAHERGLVHRDIKPSNLLLDRAGTVKLLDLGLARLVGLNEGSESLSLMTPVGAVMGTPDYMAPEQAASPNLTDIRADIYSLGCTLYHLLTGKPPFSGDSVVEKILKHREIDPVPLEQKRRDVPRALSRIVQRMMAKSADQRYATPADVAEALEPFSVVGATESLRPLEMLDPSESQHVRLGNIQIALAPPEPLMEKRGPTPGAAALRTQLRTQAAKVQWARRPLVLLASALAGLLALAVVVYVHTNRGTLTVRLMESDVDVTVDGQAVTVRSTQETDPIEVTAGEHEVKVKRGRDELYGRRIAIRRGKDVVLTATWKPGHSVESPIAATSSRPTAKTGPTAITRKKSWAPGPADGRLAGLIPRPAQLAGLGRWQVASTAFFGPPMTVAWSPDGRHVACAGLESYVRIYDAENGRLEQLFPGHEGRVAYVTWSPNSRWVASGSGMWDDPTVRIWNVREHKAGPVLRSFDGAKSQPVAWSPDGRWLATIGNEEGTIQLWDTSSWAAARLIHGLRNGLRVFAWSDDGRWLAAALNDGAIQLWDVEDDRPGALIPDYDPQDAYSLAWSPDSTRLVYAGKGNTVRIWDVKGNQPGPLLRGHTSLVFAVAWSRDGERIASGSRDGKIYLWSATDGQRVSDFNLFETHALSFDSGGRKLAVAGVPGIGVLDLTGRPLWMISGMTAVTHAVAISPDGHRVGWTGGPGKVHVHAAESGWPIWAIDVPSSGHPDSAARSLAFSPDGRWVSTAGEGGIRNYDTNAPAARDQLSLFSSIESEVLIYSQDGKRLASGGSDGQIRIWSVDTGLQETVLRGHEQGGIKALSWSPDGHWLASAGADRTIRLWKGTDGSDGRILERSPEAVRKSALGFSVDSRYLAANVRREIRIWDVSDLSHPRTLPLGSSTSLAFTPDGRLARGSEFAHEIVLRSLDGARNSMFLLQHTWSYVWLASARTGSRLVSGSWDGQTCLWDTMADPPLQWVALNLLSGRVAVFSAAGEPLCLDPGAEAEIVYVSEGQEGRFDLMTPSVFLRRADAEKATGPAR